MAEGRIGQVGQESIYPGNSVEQLTVPEEGINVDTTEQHRSIRPDVLPPISADPPLTPEVQPGSTHETQLSEPVGAFDAELVLKDKDLNLMALEEQFNASVESHNQ